MLKLWIYSSSVGVTMFSLISTCSMCPRTVYVYIYIYTYICIYTLCVSVYPSLKASEALLPGSGTRAHEVIESLCDWLSGGGGWVRRAVNHTPRWRGGWGWWWRLPRGGQEGQQLVRETDTKRARSGRWVFQVCVCVCVCIPCFFVRRAKASCYVSAPPSGCQGN